MYYFSTRRSRSNELVSYLSSCDAEVGEYTVLLVFVARVRFEALAPTVVPQLKGVVERGSQDVLAVGAELDKGHGRVVVVYQGLQALARGRVPDATQAVVTGGDYEGTVSIEVDSGHGVRMRGKGF